MKLSTWAPTLLIIMIAVASDMDFKSNATPESKRATMNLTDRKRKKKGILTVTLRLKGRVFAPRYRLAPPFPFPCGVQDVLAAYLYLLEFQ